jgi:hypothetical protein
MISYPLPSYLLTLSSFKHCLHCLTFVCRDIPLFYDCQFKPKHNKSCSARLKSTSTTSSKNCCPCATPKSPSRSTCSRDRSRASATNARRSSCSSPSSSNCKPPSRYAVRHAISQATYTDSTPICCDCLTTANTPQIQITFSWVTMSTGASSPSRPSAS